MEKEYLVYRGIIRRVDELIMPVAKELYDRRASRSEIESTVNKLMRKYGIYQRLKKLFNRKTSNWRSILDANIRKRLDNMEIIVNLSETKDAIKIRKEAEGNFNKVAGNVESGIEKELSNGIKQGIDFEQLRQKMQSVIGKGRRGAYAVANTGLTAHSRAVNLNGASRVGATKFKYTGPPAEREFCQKRLGGVFTIEEIEKMDNGQGLDVRFYGGGWNCSHRWTPVEYDND